MKAQQAKENSGTNPATFRFETEVEVFFENENIKGSDVVIRATSGSETVAHWGFSLEEILKNTLNGLKVDQKKQAKVQLAEKLKKFPIKLERSR